MQQQRQQPSHPRGSAADEMKYFAAVHCVDDATLHGFADGAVGAAAAAVVAVGVAVGAAAAVDA